MLHRSLAVSSVLAFASIAASSSLLAGGLVAQKPTGPSVVPGTLERARQALSDRIGSNPVECGRHPKPITDEAAVAASVQCVQNAAKLGRQSWTVVYGYDPTEFVQGALSERGGIVWKFVFDPYGHLGDGRATMSLSECPFPKVVQKEFVTVECSAR
jgi:hypothetical protein